MSLTTITTAADLSADERWREWEQRHAARSRKTAARARIVFTVIFIALAAWLGVELLSSPFWP